MKRAKNRNWMYSTLKVVEEEEHFKEKRIALEIEK